MSIGSKKIQANLFGLGGLIRSKKSVHKAVNHLLVSRMCCVRAAEYFNRFLRPTLQHGQVSLDSKSLHGIGIALQPRFTELDEQIIEKLGVRRIADVCAQH